MTQQAATADSVGQTHEPLELSAVVCGEPIRLVQVHLDGRPFPPMDAETTFCLDIHESEQAMANAVQYVQEKCAPEPGAILRFTPSIFTLVNTSALSCEELDIVNNELIPAGSSIFEYPKACESFEEAMNALFIEMKETRRAYSREDKPSYLSELLTRLVETLVGSASAASARSTQSVVSEHRSSDRPRASATAAE